MNNLIADVAIGKKFGSVFGQTKGFSDLVSVFLFNALAISGVILLIFFIVGGVMVIVGAGQGKSETAGRGKTAVTSALIGFLIIFCAYWIIEIVEIITDLNILNVPW